MECPFCHRMQTVVANSRLTRKGSQIWRRRLCLFCHERFTTHEVIDPSHLVVVKKSGKTELYSRAKLYSGIYVDVAESERISRERLADKLTAEAEKETLVLKKKRISSAEIGNIVLRKLGKQNPAAFLKFLAYSKQIKNLPQFNREAARYM